MSTSVLPFAEAERCRSGRTPPTPRTGRSRSIVARLQRLPRDLVGVLWSEQPMLRSDREGDDDGLDEMIIW